METGLAMVGLGGTDSLGVFVVPDDKEPRRLNLGLISGLVP